MPPEEPTKTYESYPSAETPAEGFFLRPLHEWAKVSKKW